MSDLFAHLHTHTHASTFDGYGKESQFAERVAELEQPALGLTDHGTLRGLPAMAKACKEHGVRLIPGIEAYLCDDIKLRGLTKAEKLEVKSEYKNPETAKLAVKAAEAARRDRDHITIWAMNDGGLTNLYRLSSISWNNGFYYKPRLDIETIAAHAQGLIVSTGCPGGVVSQPIRDGRIEVALRRFERLLEAFDDRLYIEIMPHAMDDCRKLQEHLFDLGSSYEVKTIATQDAHYPERIDCSAQEVLVCIQTREMMDDPDRFAARAFGNPDFYLRTREEMVEAFEATTGLTTLVLEGMCDRTVELTERCTSKFTSAPPGTYLVAPDTPEKYEDYGEWIENLCFDGWMRRLGPHSRAVHGEHGKRLQHELDVIQEHGFSRYFVMIWDVVNFCREKGIRVGPGRGSAAGSLVSYLLGITSIEPIEHKLSFERFISPGRSDLPDIDVDIQHDRRQEVIQYLRDKYGADHVAGISTSIAMRGKRCLRDAGKVFGVPIHEIERVTAVIAEGLSEEDKGDDTVAQALVDTEVGKKFADGYPDAAEAAVALEGNLRDVGIHPAGIVVTPRPVSEIVPLESRKAQGGAGRIPVVAYDMNTVEKVGLVKADFLGLKTMTVQAIACQIAGVSHDELDEVQLDDEATLQAFTDNRFGGIFQYDSPSSRRLCTGFTFKSFSDVPAITALNRPGPMKTGLAQAFLDRAKDPSKTPKIHPIYDDVTADTNGVLVYQEQLIALARELSGYTPKEADGFRKRIAKKLGVSADHDMFVRGAIDNGMEEVEAERLFSSIVGFGSYAFNRAHATAYGMIAYQLMWLKVHHPGAFYTATLAIRDKDEDLLRIAAEARRMGIAVLPPDVNISRGRFTLSDDGKSIVGSVADIKGIGPATAQNITAARPFTSFLDFYEKTREGVGRVTAATFRVLAQTTAFRSICPNTKLIHVNAMEIWKAVVKGFEVQLVPSAIDDYETDELIRIASERYRLYVDETGRGEFAAMYDEVAEHCERELLTPSEVPTTGVGYAFMMGRLNEAKLYSGGGGERSARISLLSPDGIEIIARADSDVLSACGTAMESKGEMVLVLLHIRPTMSGGANYSAERVWLATELLSAKVDSLLVAVARPGKSKPKDPIAAFHSCELEKAFGVDGMVLRVRKHKDRRGATMRTVGILGQRGYLRFFVFASRCRNSDIKMLKPGRFLDVRLKKISSDATCLTDRPIKEG